MILKKESYTERRKYTRFYFSAGDRVFGEFDLQELADELISLKILDISAGGLQYTIARDKQGEVCTGSTIILHQLKGRRALEFVARIKLEVKWIFDNPLFKNIIVGCEFMDASEAIKKKIDQFIGTRDRDRKVIFCEECGSKNVVDSTIIDSIDEHPFTCYTCKNLISRETIISYSAAINTLDTSSCSLLIIDDDLGHLQILTSMLQKKYRVAQAPTGKRGLELAEETNPDLILLDVNMPDIDGYEVCTRLKANRKTRNIPVLFVTSETEGNAEEKGLSVGAVDYITKPVDQQLLDARIAVQLKSKLLQDTHNKQIMEQESIISSLKQNRLETEVELESIRRKKKNLETILDTIDDIITIQNKERQIVWANRSALATFKTTLADIVGKPCHVHFFNTETACNNCILYRGGSESYSKPVDMYNDKLNLTLSQSQLPFFDDEGEIIGTAHLARGKTAVEPVLGDDHGLEPVAHINKYLSDHFTELNDIISVILIGADTLHDKYKDDERLNEVIKYMAEAANRLRFKFENLTPSPWSLEDK